MSVETQALILTFLFNSASTATGVFVGIVTAVFILTMFDRWTRRW